MEPETIPSNDVPTPGDGIPANGGEPPLDQHGEPSAAQVNGSIALRPIFLGNLLQSCTPIDLNLLFERPIVPVPFADDRGDPKDPFPVDRVDLKRGFCFIFLKDVKAQAEKDRIERYISEIHGMHIDKVSKQLRAEFARGDGRIKRKEDARRQKITPSETLFVVNFHEDTTKREDLQMLFEPYGELIRIDMKRNYAFVQFSSIDEARRAKEATNGGKLDQSVITVEYVARKMGDRDRERDRRRDYDRDYERGPRREPYGGLSRDSYGGPPRDRDREYYRGRDRYDDYPRGRDRYDDYARGRDRYDDYPPAPRPPRDDRYDDFPPPRDGFRGRGRSADRLLREYEPSYRRSRSRSRSPPRRPRSRSPPRRGDYHDEYGGRGAGGRGRAYDEERRRSRSYDRGEGGGGGGASRERGERFRSDDRGYGGGGGRGETAET